MEDTSLSKRTEEMPLLRKVIYSFWGAIPTDAKNLFDKTNISCSEISGAFPSVIRIRNGSIVIYFSKNVIPNCFNFSEKLETGQSKYTPLPEGVSIHSEQALQTYFEQIDPMKNAKPYTPVFD